MGPFTVLSTRFPGVRTLWAPTHTPSFPKGPRATVHLTFRKDWLAMPSSYRLLSLSLDRESATVPRATTQLRAQRECPPSHGADPDSASVLSADPETGRELGILLALSGLTLPRADGGSAPCHGTLQCSTIRHNHERQAARLALHRLWCKQGKAMVGNDRLPRTHSEKRNQAQAGYKGGRVGMGEERATPEATP